jgi:hypothetical protein
MLSSRLADNLNSDLGRSTWSVSKKICLNLLANFLDKAVGACCTEQGAATDSFGGPLYK